MQTLKASPDDRGTHRDAFPEPEKSEQERARKPGATERRSALRAKLAAAFAVAPGVPTGATAEPPTDPHAAAKAELAAAIELSPQQKAQALLQARTLADFSRVMLLLKPGRDKSRDARAKLWTDRLGDVPLVELSAAQVDAVITELETVPGPSGKMRSGATINRHRAALASIIKFARERRRLPLDWVSPLAHIPIQPEGPGIGRSLTRDEEARLMAAAALQAWPLLPLLIRMALTTALRKGNVWTLQWRHVDLAERVLRIPRDEVKNGEPHIAPLTADVVAALAAIKPADAADWHFVFAGKSPNKPHNFHYCWTKARREAGLAAGFRFHDLRHSSCSRLGEAGKSALEIAAHSGHKSLAMVMKYTHLSVTPRAKMVNEVFG